MALFKNLFHKKSKRDEAALTRVRAWLIAEMGEPAPTLTISEIECGDPACPGLETIVLVMREGEATQALRIRIPIQSITLEDVQSSLASFKNQN